MVPVDKLGNLGAEAKANEVRVAYDKTISDDLYTLVHDGDTVTITVKNGASVPVTGIKVTGTGLSGSYTVQVKANAGADWTDAKTGELSVFASEWAIAAKALQPLPALHKELNDDTRTRKPYLA